MSDFTSPLRSMRGPFLSEAEPLQSGKITPGMGAMQAGAVSTLTGMSAGSTANDALAAERAGSPNFSALRARAGELARLSEEQAPPVRSMADINGVEDAVKFVAGGAGSMLPYIPVAIGGAVAGRILGPSALRAANPTIGMAATMYPLEKGQGVLEQYMDPVQAAQPIDRRDEVATTRALINAGLLGGAANSVLRGIAGRAARGPIFSAVEAGLPMAASTYVGQRAAAELNPERDASHDNMALADSLVLGGLLGAAGHVPSGMAHMAGKAVDAIPRPRMPERQPRAPEELGPAAEPIIPQSVADTVGEFAGTVNERVVQPGVKKAAEMFNEYKPKAEEYATKSSEFVDETLRKFNDAAKEAQDFPDFVRRAFGDKDLSDAETLAEGDKAPAYKKADGSVDEEKLFASDEPRRAKTEQYAADLLNNPNTSETVKERIRAFNGDYSSEEAQKYVGNTILGQRAGERAADAIKAFKKAATDLLSKAKGAAIDATKATGKAIDDAKDAVIRKSEMSSKTQLELEKTIFGSLKNELQTQSGVVAQVPELAKVISKLLSQGASVDDQALRAFGGFRALDALFDNPAEAVSAIAKTLGTDDLYKRTTKFRTASEDARKADSMLYKAIPQERRDVIKAKELREIGHVVDALGTIKDEKQYKTMLSALAKHVYGDEATAKAVVDFYTRNNEADLAVDSPDAKIPKMSEDIVEGEHISELEKQGLSVEKPEEQVVYSSVDEGKKRPFHVSQLKKLADKLEVERGPTGRGRVEKLSNHVIMEDGDPVATLAEIEGDIKRRIQDHKDHKEYTQGTEIQREYRANQIKDLAEQLNQIERRKGEVRNDAMLKDADPYTKAMYEAMSALQDFYVGKVQAESGDKLAADDKFMRDAGYGYSKMTKENREKNKDQFITFEMSDGKKKILHGPSMVRAMSKKQGTTGDDSGTAREARLLRDAVASVLARPDVVSIAGGETTLHNLKFNESMSLGAARAETNKRTAEIMAANKAMREAQAALDKNYEAVRAAIAENKEAIEAGLDYLPRNKKFFAKLEAEREVLRAKIKKAIEDGADEPMPEKSEKRERETQGVTDIQTELVNPEGKTRINLLDKDERPDRSTNTSPGKYERRTIEPKARDAQITDEGELARQRAIGRNRAAEKDPVVESAKREQEIDRILENMFGKDGTQLEGRTGDPDKATPGYLKKERLRSDVDAEFKDENYTSSLHGPEENRARIEAGKKMLRDLATKHELDDAVRARVEEGLEWAVEMSKKETLTDAELAEASKRIARIVDAFGAAALDKQNKPDGWSIEEILTDSHMLRAEIFKALVPVSRKAEERAHQIIKDALGEKFESFITPFIDGSGRVAGQYMASDKGYERISLSSVISAMSWGRDADTGLVATAHHEIMHAIVTRIERQFGIDALKKLSDAAQQDRIKNQVLKAVENLGEDYKKYLLDNPEELLVETYAQWRLGNVEILPVDKRLKGFFGAIKEFVRSLFDMLSQDELLQTVFDRVSEGYFKDRDFVGTNLLESMKNRRDVGMLTYDGSTGGKTTRLESRRSQEVHDELGRKGIAAAHDSPFRFDGKFDWRKHSLKGQGAAAFGRGTYLSTADGVHKSYKHEFTAKVKRDTRQENIAFEWDGKEFAWDDHKGIDELNISEAKKYILHGALDFFDVNGNDTIHTSFPFSGAAKDSIVEFAQSRLVNNVTQLFDSVVNHISLLEDDAKYSFDGLTNNPKPFSKEETMALSAARIFADSLSAKLAAAEPEELGVITGKPLLGTKELQNILGNLEAQGFKSYAIDLKKAAREFEKMPDLLKKMDNEDFSAFSEPKKQKPSKFKEDTSPTYHVTVKGDANELLDWNLTLDEQTDFVKAKLRKFGYGIEERVKKQTFFEKWNPEQITRLGSTEKTWRSESKDGNYFAIINERNNRLTIYEKIPSGFDRVVANETFNNIIAAKYRADRLLRSTLSNIHAKKTGEWVYRDLSRKLGGEDKASDALQNAGIFGHRFNSSGGSNRKFPNYVIYDDARIENNYVEFSKQRPSPGRDITPEEAQEVRDYVLKTRGPRVKVVTDEFAKDIGGSGSYFKNAQERVIKIARDALNPLSTAYHESMHDFFHTLLSDKDSRRLRTDLLRAADLPYVQAQLRVLLRDHPDALKQVLDSPEERLSYMYQFWAAGHLRVSPFANTLFGKVTKWIKDVLGIVSVGDKGEAIMAAFHDGRLADPSTAGAVIADLNMKTIGERLEKLSGPLGRVAERMLTPATERLHNSSIPALKELAEMFHREPDRESGGLPFLQKRMKTGAEFTNKFQNLVENASNTDMATALKELQSMQQPTTELGRGIRKLLDEMYTYMSEAGVENSSLDMATKKVVWNPIRQVKDYFPRVWDRAIIRQRADEFKQLLMTEGRVDRAEADAVVDAITSGDGLIELSETEHHLGFTPYNSAVKERAMKFITSQNAHMFEPFQEKDLVKVMHTYIYQAAHRGEYARFFGNDGEKIKELLFRATKEGASEEEITAAAKTVRAMEGTLGAEIPGRLREVYSAVVGYENIVLLPFALFSSFIDPLGVAVRSGKMADAAVAFKDGIKGLFEDLLRMDKDAEYEMAKTIGIISELNKLEAMGQVMESQYMSKWMRKFNDKFFKWNGMETWNERMRVSAMGAGMRFLVRNKNNERYLNELGIKSSDIRELPDGKIARTQAEGLTKEQEQRVQEALFKFVDGAILRPNAAHRPVWASDPHYMLIAHLKQYTFSFQQTILKQVKKEFMNGNNMPAFILASYIPFMAVSDLLRGSITGSIQNSWTLADFIADGVARSGILGTGSFATDAMKDAAMGNMPGSSFLGPAGQHAVSAFQTMMGAGGKDWSDLFMRSVPASPLFKAVT